MKRKSTLISIIISNFNTKVQLKNTLLSVLKHTYNVSFEIILIDDASSDGTMEMLARYFPKIKVISNKRNLGYSKSYNKGTKLAKGKYILHLNSDVIFTNNSTLKSATDFMDKNMNVGILGCKIIKSDGSLDLPCKRSFPTIKNVFFQSVGLAKLFPKNKSFGEYYLSYLNENKVADVDCIMGAFMLIRGKMFKKIGYLDERFFIYGEDIDYCLRVKKTGMRVVYFPLVRIKHLHGGTTRKAKLRHIWLFHYAMIQYYQKHYKKSSVLLFYIVYAGIIARFIECLLNEYVLNFTFYKRQLSL